jgi:hypothetical protein
MARPRKGNKPVVDTTVLAAALEGLELQRTRIEESIRQVRALLGQPKSPRAAAGAAEAAGPGRRKRRPLSAAARKRIAAAQKRRWANFRKAAKGAEKEG